MKTKCCGKDGKELKVLHCIYSLSGGGAERQLNLLLSGSSDNTVFCHEDDLGGSALGNNKLIVYKKNRKTDIGVFKAIANVIDKEKPDIIHAWLPPVVTIPTLMVAWKKNIPVVFSYRNTMKIRNWQRLLEILSAYFLSNGIISNTNPRLCSLPYQYLYKLKHGAYIRNAVDVLNIQHQANQEYLNHLSPLKLHFIGRISDQKNWRCLINALHLLRDKIPCTLTICGQGEEELELREMVQKLSLDDKVELSGYKKNIYEIMSLADVLVLPSWYEGMPNVLLEAFAIGLPAIVSDIPPHRDLLDDSDAAILFDPHSPQELADSIVNFYENPATSKSLSNKGHAIAADYTVKGMKQAYNSYYRKIVEKCN